jgi:hypothetical protein
MRGQLQPERRGRGQTGRRSNLIVAGATEYERAVFFRLGRIRQGAKGPDIVAMTSLRSTNITLPAELLRAMARPPNPPDR